MANDETKHNTYSCNPKIWNAFDYFVTLLEERLPQLVIFLLNFQYFLRRLLVECIDVILACVNLFKWFWLNIVESIICKNIRDNVNVVITTKLHRHTDTQTHQYHYEFTYLWLSSPALPFSIRIHFFCIITAKCTDSFVSLLNLGSLFFLATF